MAKDINALVQDLQQQVAAYRPGNEHQRQQLLDVTQQLTRAIETPEERIAKMCYLNNHLFFTTRVLIDLNVFSLLTDAEKPMAVSELATRTEADQTLLERLMKHICTQDFVKETGADEYEANDTTRLLATPEGQGVVVDMFLSTKYGGELPAYLRKNKYANPIDKDKTAWKYGMGTDKHYFEWLGVPGNEMQAEAFHNHMRFKTLGLKWHEMPELMSAVFGDVQPSAENVLIVDLGGSSGHDLVGFRAAHPDIFGRLILQDLPHAIAATNKKELDSHTVEAMAHDFFTPEPVAGAKTYYLKMVLHDWPNEQCKNILANIKPAMRPGYSRILLNEIIIPETNARWFETGVDMIMLTCHSAHERREKAWRSLIEEVGGLKVNKIWEVAGAIEKVIEIELAY